MIQSSDIWQAIADSAGEEVNAAEVLGALVIVMASVIRQLPPCARDDLIEMTDATLRDLVADECETIQ